jgi:EmrB/QacA subfamily drug resistance transporter
MVEAQTKRPAAQAPPRTDTTTAQQWAALALLCAAQFLTVLNFQVATVALPGIGRDLAFSQQALQWVVSAHALAFGGSLLLAGRLADIAGHRRLFMLGLGTFAAATLACGLAPSGAILIVARVVQGIGTALFTPAALALLSDTFPAGTARNRALGIWSAAGPLGGIAGLLGGGLLAGALGWRWVFFIGVPVAALTLACTPFALAGHRERSTGERLDWAGALVGTAGIVAVVYGLNGVAAATSAPLLVAVPLVGGIALLALFVAIERRMVAPLVPLKLLGRRALLGPNLVGFLHAAVTNTPFFFFVLYMQQIRGYSPFITGLAFLPCNLALVAGAALGGRGVDRFGQRRMMIGGMILEVVSLLLLARIAVTGSYWTTLLPGLLFEGFGLAIVQVATVGAVTTGAAERERGLAAGLFNTAAQIGTAVGLSLLVTIAVARTASLAGGSAPAAEALTDGYRWAFLGGSVLAVIGLLLAIFLVRETESERRQSDPATAQPAEAAHANVHRALSGSKEPN